MPTSTTSKSSKSNHPVNSSSSAEANIVSHKDWLASRIAFLKKEKEFTRLRDQISKERRALPWEKVETEYVFQGPKGDVTLSDIFEKRSQLVIYHFMFGVDWDEGCPSCSFVTDHFDPMLPHLHARDVTMALVSHAPLDRLTPFKKRMGWKIPWYSSFGSPFNTDYHVSFSSADVDSGHVYYNYALQDFPIEEAPGFSVFKKSLSGDILHTYSTFGRGVDMLMGTYQLLDIVPKGRDEDKLERSMEWVRYHDKYDERSA